jgi:hypothetical protein
MQNFKRLLAIIVSIALIATFTTPVFSAETADKTNAQIIEVLGMIGGVNGEITNEFLASQPTRLAGAHMLLRLLGKEAEAKAFIPPEGFQNYVDAVNLSAEEAAVLAYLKANPGIGFDGITNNRFAPNEKLTTEQYKRTMLVALGCANGEPGDFTEEALDAYASSKELIIASDTSAEKWKAKADFICSNGEISAALRTAMILGHGIFSFAPGEYWIEGPSRSLLIGSDTIIKGINRISQPAKMEDMLYPNPQDQAVFLTRTELPSQQSSNETQMGYIKTVPGASNITISNIAISGYAILKLDNAVKCNVSNVLIHNYRGTYPNGQWCNMGYGGATASLWLYGNCTDINIENCQIQCSSHHGLALHTGSNSYLSKNINISGCRALYCGSGQLRGETAEQQQDAAARVPETQGYGYRDWSVAYDLCENQSVEKIVLEDCYALEGWKCGFYTEPEETGGHIKNLVLKRCRSEKAGQRAVIPGSDPKATMVKETEGSNFYMQGGYFEDCISVDGEKCGWYIDSNRIDANPTGEGKVQMIRCGDVGSPISLVTEMFDSSNLHTNGFWSINAKDWAMWLFGGDGVEWPGNDFDIRNTLIIAPSNQSHPVIKIGYMLRQQLRESRDPDNQAKVAPRGKYDVLRAHLTDSKISGCILNLSDKISPIEIVNGASFNGYGSESNYKKIQGIDLKVYPKTIFSQLFDNGKLTSLSNLQGLLTKYFGNIVAKGMALFEDRYKDKVQEVFTVNDLAAVTVKTLKMNVKDGGMTLIAKLVEEGAISEEAAINSTLYTPPVPDTIFGNKTYYSSKLPFVSYKTEAIYTGKINIQYDTIPAANNIDGVIAYADSGMNVSGFGNLAMLVRFNTDGYFDVRNGSSGQQKLADVPYTTNMKYHVEIAADIDAKTYSIYITPDGGQRTEIARDFGFRASAAAATDDIGQAFLISENGDRQFKVQNHVVQAADAAYYSRMDWIPSGYNLGASNTSKQTIQFDTTPLANNIDGVIAYADSSMNVTSFGNLAMLVRFNTDGLFDVRNGSNGQQKLVDVPYTANTKYHIEIIADMDTKTYSVYITPDGGQRFEVARDFGFRASAAADTDDIGQAFFISEYGDNIFKVQNHVVQAIQ